MDLNRFMKLFGCRKFSELAGVWEDSPFGRATPGDLSRSNPATPGHLAREPLLAEFVVTPADYRQLEGSSSRSLANKGDGRGCSRALRPADASTVRERLSSSRLEVTCRVIAGYSESIDHPPRGARSLSQLLCPHEDAWTFYNCGLSMRIVSTTRYTR